MKTTDKNIEIRIEIVVMGKKVQEMSNGSFEIGLG